MLGLYNLIYSDKIYDLEIDSSKLTPEESARMMINFIHTKFYKTPFKTTW